MLDLAKVRLEDFAACLGQDFDILFSDGPLRVKLIEAKPWGPGQAPPTRQPFTLTFRVARNVRFPQGTYKVHNPNLDEMEIFLVQVGGDADNSTLEAVFN